MKSKKVLKIILLIAFLLLVVGGYIVVEEVSPESQKIKIANWNLQIFGQSKAEKPELMQLYVDKIDDYDIVFIQEIRDKAEIAFPQLCSMLEPKNYSCQTSSRAGRSSSKEQYGIIYKSEIQLTSFKDFNPDEQDRWERPPIKATFLVDDYTLIIYNIHTKPGDVQKELGHLQKVVSDSGNVVVLGDLNADCFYYNAKKQTEFDSWKWIIKDSDDTTVATSSCAYDRIILNSDANQEFSSYGIVTENINKEVSDHYLVWVELEI